MYINIHPHTYMRYIFSSVDCLSTSCNPIPASEHLLFPECALKIWNLNPNVSKSPGIVIILRPLWGAVMEAFPDGTECFWFSIQISGRELSEDCRRGCIQNQHRGHNFGVIQVLVFAVLYFLVFTVPGSRGLGSMSTIAAISGGNNTATVCGIRSGTDKQSIQCWDSRGTDSIPILPNISFLGISGGNGVFCGLADRGLGLFCWSPDGGRGFSPKRISKNRFLRQMAVGESHICGLTNATNSPDNIECWRGRNIGDPREGRFSAIAAGGNFTCGIRQSDFSVHCWGSLDTSGIPGREPMRSVFAGESHACGISLSNGSVHCWGKNDSGQLSVPVPRGPFEFESLALGENHSCGIRAADRTVVCWGFNYSVWEPRNLTFETIVAGDRFTCGVLSGNFSVLCWGGRGFESGVVLPSMPKILPRLCDSDTNPCQCDEYPDWRSLCANSRRICLPCVIPLHPESPPPRPPPPHPPPPPREITKKNSKAIVAFAVVGSAGTLIGILTILWCLYAKLCSQGRVQDSAQQVSTSNAASLPAPRMTRRQSSQSMAGRRQRSGTSSKHGDRPEEFSFLILAMVTDNFSDEHRIGSGSFGTVYKANLPDGRVVAIKRSEIRTGAKKHQENESAFQSELSFMSRLHHKHLVGLVGFCDEEEERLLVYEFMPNGSLHDHLHRPDESFRSKSPLNSWAMRIKVALDAARGIEYLHTYAVPPIIHRDIKSSNILLDGAWNARVSDFGLSLMGPEEENSHLSLMAAGTVGYIDPEYYRMQHLTTKTDVYSFGVVLLELLTGQKAIHKDDGSGGPRNVVDYAIPHILAAELPSILDPRLPPPRSYEIEAVTFVGYIGADCVNLEGKDRPSMTEIVANLEKAFRVCVQVDAMSRSSSLTLQR